MLMKKIQCCELNFGTSPYAIYRNTIDKLYHHLKVVCIEHDRLRPTEEDGADRDPGHQLDDGGVGLILLWLRYPQQAGQETVPLMDLVTCRILNIKMITLQ